MGALFSLLMFPIIIFNACGGIVAGIWLAVQGEWQPLLIGIGGLCASVFAISIALMPGFLFGVPAIVLIEKGWKAPGYTFAFIGLLYTNLVMLAWHLGALVFFMKDANHHTFWPLLIWSYSIATGPWGYMAQKEMQGGNDSGIMSASFAAWGYMVAMGMLAFTHPTLNELAYVIGGFLLLATVLNLINTVAQQRTA